MNINVLTPSVGPQPRSAAGPASGRAAPSHATLRAATPVERVVEGELLSGRRVDPHTVTDAFKRLLVQRGGAAGNDAGPSPGRARAAIDSYVSNSAPGAGRGGLDIYV